MRKEKLNTYAAMVKEEDDIQKKFYEIIFLSTLYRRKRFVQ